MSDAFGEGIGQPPGRVLDEAQRLGDRHALADLEDLAQVAALDKLHHDEMLFRRGILVDGEDFDDVGLAQGDAEAGLAVELVDHLGVFGPALAQHLDGDDAAGVRIDGAKDAAETAGGDAVQQPVAAEEVAVHLAFEELAALKRRQLALAFQDAQENLGVGVLGSDLLQGVFQLGMGYQP